MIHCPNCNSSLNWIEIIRRANDGLMFINDLHDNKIMFIKGRDKEYYCKKCRYHWIITENDLPIGL